MSKDLSDCHHAPVTIEGDETRYYVCSLCEQPCGLKDWEGTEQDLTK